MDTNAFKEQWVPAFSFVFAAGKSFFNQYTFMSF